MHTLSSDPTSFSIFVHLVWGLEFRRCLREEKVDGVAEGQDVFYPGRLGQEVLGGKKQKAPKRQCNHYRDMKVSDSQTHLKCGHLGLVNVITTHKPKFIQT